MQSQWIRYAPFCTPYFRMSYIFVLFTHSTIRTMHMLSSLNRENITVPMWKMKNEGSIKHVDKYSEPEIIYTYYIYNTFIYIHLHTHIFYIFWDVKIEFAWKIMLLSRFSIIIFERSDFTHIRFYKYITFLTYSQFLRQSIFLYVIAMNLLVKNLKIIRFFSQHYLLIQKFENIFRIKWDRYLNKK